jgi:uncharacterized membrane protein
MMVTMTTDKNKIKTGYLVFLTVAVLTLTAGMCPAHAASSYVSLTVNAAFSPTTIGPGDSASMVLSIANTGTVQSGNVRVTMLPNPHVTFGQQSYDMQAIAPLSSVQVSVPLTVNSGAIPSSVPIFLKVDYFVGDSSTTNSIQTSVNLPIASKLFLQISGVDFSEPVIQPGDLVNVTVHISNVGHGNVKSASALFGGAGMPFVSSFGDNNVFIGDILAGTSADAVFSIILNKNALTTAYSVPLVLSYYDDSGVLHSDARSIGLKVSGMPDFVVAFESATGMNSGSQNGELTVSIANRGIATAGYLTLTFNAPDGITIEPSQYYVGNLDPDDFQTVKVSADLRGVRAGRQTLGINMTYKDPYNKEMSKYETVDFSVSGPVPSGNNTYVLVGLLVVAAVAYWKRKGIMRLVRGKSSEKR